MKNTFLTFLLAFSFTLNAQTTPIDAANNSDCATPILITEMRSYLIFNALGVGKDKTEINSSNAPCFANSGTLTVEYNSTWFKFTCVKKGKIAFTIDPINAKDDIDFALFSLKNGDCQNKTIVRCMAAGDNSVPSPCMGSTGLNFSSTDLSEGSGCGVGKDNFLKALDMEVGETYALFVNNFTSQGNFVITFTGDAGIGKTIASEDIALVPKIDIRPTISNTPSFEVFFEQKNQVKVSLSVFDALGRELKKEQNIYNSQRIDLANNTTKGIYFIRLNVDNQIVVKKFIFE